MRRLGFALAGILLLAGRTSAQTATPTNHFEWTEVGQSATVAQGATYNYYADGTATPSGQLSGVTCTASGADAACTSNIPPFTGGNHTVTITQVSGTAESAKSNLLSFTFVDMRFVYFGAVFVVLAAVLAIVAFITRAR